MVHYHFCDDLIRTSVGTEGEKCRNVNHISFFIVSTMIKGTLPPSKKLSNVCQLYVILWSKFCWTRISHLFFAKITQFLKNRSYIIWAGDVIPKIRGIWAVEKSLIWAPRHFLRRLVQNSSACSTFHKQKNIIISTVDKSREKVWRHQKIGAIQIHNDTYFSGCQIETRITFLLDRCGCFD